MQCDSRATCVNLPGWYHCECREGYHDKGMLTANGESCEGSLKVLKTFDILLKHFICF